MSNTSESSSQGFRKKRITFIHPDLGIGGAERLVIDAALALQSAGHRVIIYTSHRDKDHCFEEARNGKLDVRIHEKPDKPTEKGKDDFLVDEEYWKGKKVLLSINRFERKKNLELAIKAYHLLGDRDRRDTRLVIAGGYDTRVQENVDYHKELESLAQSLDLKTTTCKTALSALSAPDDIDVMFLLSVPTLLKETLLKSSKLLLYTPSHEHFGIVPVEAMFARLPVLAVNTGGPLETVVEGETGWLRTDQGVGEWTNVIRKVLWQMSPEELREMGENGRRRVQEKFSLRAMGENLEKVIDTMLDNEPKQFLEFRHMVLLLQSMVLMVVALVLTVFRVWMGW
ncbi:alpha-1,3-mannosyltransferase alg-2 [Ascosphaera apis ARSEF 7405]|uniref:Alpha-1,3/1,6-mannosyltransferase ALG2 n=1 Tax=Ascosphaera apis ARSEF 7405 TaxID=392613 RepID=A0A167XRX0_9EURO|nr:alpha-1,3-mannosyltransferase alg-2 [Ascosphaera apis ARSEF 7405]